jgi:hypothetical protein
LNDELAAQHVHAAGKSKLALFVRREFDGRGLEGGQFARDAKVAEDDSPAARRRLVAVKVETKIDGRSKKRKGLDQERDSRGTLFCKAR